MRLVLTALVLLLGMPASAARADTAIMFEYDANANPSLAAVAEVRSGQSGVRVIEWRACPPDGSACTPLPDSAYGSRQRCAVLVEHCFLDASPGDVVPGTVFEAAFDTDGTITTRRTSAWEGKVTSSGPATLLDAVVGRAPRVTTGTWSGGWAAAPDVPAAPGTSQGLLACRNPAGTECFALGGPSLELSQRWAGWYLYVDELRWFDGRWSHLFGIAMSTPMLHPYRLDRLPDLGPNQTRSAPVQVCCVLPAPAADAPAARPASPTASIRTRAQRRNGRLHVASVHCAVRCAVRLTVTSSKHTLVRSLSVQGARSLSIPPRRGLLRVQVFVDGKLLAGGRSRAR